MNPLLDIDSPALDREIARLEKARDRVLPLIDLLKSVREERNKPPVVEAPPREIYEPMYEREDSFQADVLRVLTEEFNGTATMRQMRKKFPEYRSIDIAGAVTGLRRKGKVKPCRRKGLYEAS